MGRDSGVSRQRGETDGVLYDWIMQIAITVPDEQVDEIDNLVPALYRSRAEVVRVALDDLLRAHRRRVIDDQYLAALEAAGTEVAAGSLRAGDPEPAAWADIPW